MSLPQFISTRLRQVSPHAKQRLVRGGLAFIVFGTATAILPGSDLSAVSAASCFTAGANMILSYDPAGTSSPSAAPGTIPVPTIGTFGSLSDLRVFISPTGLPATYQNASDINFPGRTLKFGLTTPSSATESFTAVYTYAFPMPGLTATAPIGGGSSAYVVTGFPPVDATELYASQKGESTPPSSCTLTVSFILGTVTLTDTRSLLD